MYKNITERLTDYYKQHTDQFVEDLEFLGIIDDDENIDQNEVFNKYFNDKMMLKIIKETVHGSSFNIKVDNIIGRGVNYALIRADGARISEYDEYEYDDEEQLLRRLGDWAVAQEKEYLFEDVYIIKSPDYTDFPDNADAEPKYILFEGTDYDPWITFLENGFSCYFTEDEASAYSKSFYLLWKYDKESNV